MLKALFLANRQTTEPYIHPQTLMVWCIRKTPFSAMYSTLLACPIVRPRSICPTFAQGYGDLSTYIQYEMGRTFIRSSFSQFGALHNPMALGNGGILDRHCLYISGLSNPTKEISIQRA